MLASWQVANLAASYFHVSLTDNISSNIIEITFKIKKT